MHCSPVSRHIPRLIPVLLFLPSPAAAQREWKEFVSARGFTVAYPASWRRVDTLPDGLDIMSSSDFAEGVRIARGEAEIGVSERRDATGHSLAQIIAQDQHGDSLLSRRPIYGVTGCDSMTETVYKSQEGPGAYEIDRVFYCQVRGRLFTTILRHWADDKRQAQYQAIALRMAKSFRLRS
jgi:hypothetical protein